MKMMILITKILFLIYQKNEIQNELNNLQNFRMEGFSLLNDNSFEVAVQILENKMPSSHYFGRDMFHTNGHGYDLSITKIVSELTLSDT